MFTQAPTVLLSVAVILSPDLPPNSGPLHLQPCPVFNSNVMTSARTTPSTIPDPRTTPYPCFQLYCLSLKYLPSGTDFT